MKVPYNDVFSMQGAHRIKALNDAPIFLPQSWLQSTVVPAIGITAISLAVIYTMAFLWIERAAKYRTLPARRKLAYQVTNLCANLVLCLTGFYYEYFVTPTTISVEERVQGFQSYYILSSIQLGYQLWAIPIGLFHVNESAAMMLHHIAVIFTAFMSGFCTNGFRYWTPFFFGMLESSSVPLAVMNMFKDNPDWIKQNPTFYSVVRIAFAVTFLVVRLIMFLPRKLCFLRDHAVLFLNHSNPIYQSYMGVVWLGSAFLMALQLYWSTLILKGLFKIASPKDKQQ